MSSLGHYSYHFLDPVRKVAPARFCFIDQAIDRVGFHFLSGLYPRSKIDFKQYYNHVEANGEPVLMRLLQPKPGRELANFAIMNTRQIEGRSELPADLVKFRNKAWARIARWIYEETLPVRLLSSDGRYYRISELPGMLPLRDDERESSSLRQMLKHQRANLVNCGALRIDNGGLLGTAYVMCFEAHLLAGAIATETDFASEEKTPTAETKIWLVKALIRHLAEFCRSEATPIKRDDVRTIIESVKPRSRALFEKKKFEKLLTPIANEFGEKSFSRTNKDPAEDLQGLKQEEAFAQKFKRYLEREIVGND